MPVESLLVLSGYSNFYLQIQHTDANFLEENWVSKSVVSIGFCIDEFLHLLVKVVGCDLIWQVAEQHTVVCSLSNSQWMEEIIGGGGGEEAK